MCPMTIVAAHRYPALGSALSTLQLEVLITSPIIQMGRQAQRGGQDLLEVMGQEGTAGFQV